MQGLPLACGGIDNIVDIFRKSFEVQQSRAGKENLHRTVVLTGKGVLGEPELSAM